MTKIYMLFIAITFASGQAMAQFRYSMDMVHHNPGEVLFNTKYDKPDSIKAAGAKGKVFYLFHSGVLGLNWESFDATLLPKGTAERTWIDNKAAEINERYNEAKAAGLEVYCMSDLMIFPKKLLEKYGMTTRFKDINDAMTQQLLREELRMMFRDFPQLDGIVVRIGETYMHDAPYHSGGINNKSSSTVIIPLMQILREEVCVKLNKRVVFRTWWSFDTSITTYNEVSNAVQPHDNLVISVKHCEGDFHRGNPYARVLGIGRHKQIVEVQCAREYEGKGAFPNYIANGVIEGFEEYKYTMPTTPITNLRKLYEQSPLFDGVWTWSKGGGWDGPYIKNDLWNELNTWVMLQWNKNPNKSEEELFNEYATTQLGIYGESLKQFRTLALLSADAVIRGHRSTHADVDPWWTRDHYISAPPALPSNTVARARVIDQKKEAVQMFERIVRLADSINVPNADNKRFIQISARYGLHIHRIYDIAFQLKQASLSTATTRNTIDSLLANYDLIWADYKQFAANNPDCPTLYTDLAYRNNTNGSLREFVATLRKSLEGIEGTYIKKVKPGILSNIVSVEMQPQVGKKLYSDRTYLFTEVPTMLNNAEYIIWKNDYKNYSNNPMLSFETNTDGTLYIAHDQRLAKPEWITSNYTPTTWSFAVPDTRLELFSRKIEKNQTIELGNNHNMGSVNNSTLYIVFFAPTAISSNEKVNFQTFETIVRDNYIEIKNSSTNSTFNYKLLNTSGKTFANGYANDNAIISNIPKGFYILKITNENKKTYIKKIII